MRSANLRRDELKLLTNLGEYMEPQMPSLGRIVHYRDYDGRDYAAIITQVPGGPNVDLEVFGTYSKKIQTYVPYAENPYANTWHWPERV